MTIVYRLIDNPSFIASIQKATQTTTQFGIEPTHGLLGSPEWWGHIKAGRLPVQTVRGTILRTYMASMNDWPEFEIQSESGALSRWTREANSAALATLYEVGRPVELDFVVQHHRPESFDFGAETRVVLEVRVGDAA